MDLDVDDVVWAKMRGYPYWPALITVEASSGLFKKGNGASRKFHVDFLGGEWISKWIKVSEVRKFEAEDTGPNRKKDYRASARWEALHLAAMKLGLDKLLQKGGLTLRMEPNQAKEPSLAQHSSDTLQDMKVDKEDSDRQVPMSEDFSVVSREATQFFTPEQEFTLTSPHQQFFTPSLNGSFLFHASPEVNPKEGQLGIKFSPEQTKLDYHQWSSTPLKTESGFLEPRKDRSSSLKQKKTMKSKKKSEDTTWRRKSRRQSMSHWVRDEPDLVSSPQLDAHWLKPFKCRICHTRFGWTAERDSHELICEGEVQGSEEYGVKCEVDDLKVDLSAASESTVNEDFTALGQLATKVDLAFESLVSGKEDSKTGSQSGLKILANESHFNEKLGMVEKLAVELHQPSDNQTNLQLVHCESPDTVLESEFYVGNYAEVEWRTEEYGLEANNRLEEDMEIVEGEEVDTREGLPDNSAGAEESMDMEMKVSNDAGITLVKTGLKRKIDLQDHDENKYDSVMKRRRLSVLESASLSRKDTNETDDQVVNSSNAEHGNSETRCQDNIYSMEMSDNQGNDQIFLVDNQVYDQLVVSPENDLVIDEDCWSEEILIVSANSVGSHQNNNKMSEMISLEKDESRSHENPPNNTQADNLVPFEQSSVYSLVKSDNSKNAPESNPECSHMESRVDGELNDEGFPEEGATFDPPISSAKSYPKMNSLKDEKKMSSKFENCILSPRVKTKAELKDYGEETTRTMEKISQNSHKSPLLSQDKENLLKQTRDRNKSKTQSHANVKSETPSHAIVKSETQSHAKVKSEIQSHANVKSETQSHAKVKSEIKSHCKIKSEMHDKVKSAPKTHDQGKSATKTHDQGKSATKTHEQGKSATKTHEQGKSATKTLDKIKSATETHDQGKSTSKTHDKAKLATKNHDQGKLASKTNDKIKLGPKPHDKVKSSSKTHDKVKSSSKTHGQGTLATQALRIKLVTKTQDRVKSSTKTHDQGMLTSKTCNKIKAATNMHNKVNLPTKSHERGETTAKTHDQVKTRETHVQVKTRETRDQVKTRETRDQVKTRETHDQVKTRETHEQGKLTTKIHDESRLATQSHDAATKTCGKLPKIPKRTHDEGKLLTCNSKQGKLPTATHGKPKLASKSHDKKMPSTSRDTGDKSKLLTQTGDKKQFDDRSRVTRPVPSDQSQLSIAVRDKRIDNNNTKDHVQIKRCSEEQFGDKNAKLANISHEQKSGQDNIRIQESKKIHSMDTFARDKERHKKQNNVRSNESLKDRTDYANRRVEPPSSRQRSNFRQESKEYCKDSSKTISNREDANLKVKDVFKATYAKHDVNLKERDRDTFKATSIKRDSNSKRNREDYKRPLKATSDNYDYNVKDKRSENSGHSGRLLDNKHGRNISKDSDTKISSHSEQLSLRYQKALLDGKKELKPSKYRFKEKSTGVDKRWSRNSSPPSSPDAEDKHWKRQKGYQTQNDQHKDENPAIRNECKLDKNENLNNNDNHGRGGKQFYRHHIRRDKEEYPQENLFPRSDEDMPDKLRDCQASEAIDDIKNGNLLILNEQEMGIQCLEIKVEQEENPEYSKQNEEVRTCDVQENDTNQIENFSYNDSNKVQEFPVWDANDYLEFPNYDVSAATLDKLPSKNIFDSHCHLDILFYKLTDKPRRFNEGYMPNGIQLQSFTEFKKYYEREIHDKFEGCVTNFCDPKQWNVTQAIPDLIRSLDREEGVYYTVGCHPRHADFMMNKKSRDALERIVKWGKGKGGKCVAIGECGLDFNNHNPYKRSTSFSTQRAVFKFQLELAMELDFPLVLHIRDAEEKAYAVMEEVGLPSDHPIHRHCFNDSWSACQTWLKKFPGSFIGLTNLLLKPGVKHLHEVARLIPLERLILETDSPYFSPRVENRVFPLDLSHPGDVVHVAAMVAKLKKDSLQNVLAANRRNIATLYRIREEPRAKPGQWRVDGRKR